MKIVPTPEWFLGKDIMIEVFSFIVLMIFVFLAFRYYKLIKNRSIFYLGFGFGLIALAQLAAIFTKLVLYYNIGPSQAIGQAIVTSQIVSSVNIFYFSGFLVEKFLTLTGLYLIYRLPRARKLMVDYIIIAFFVLVSALPNREFFYIYHVTAIILLTLMVENYYRIYLKNGFINTKILMTAFGILAISQLIFILPNEELMFVLGNMVELISYTILLALIIRIWKYGKEKKSYGNNFGYAGNPPRKRRKH